MSKNQLEIVNNDVVMRVSLIVCAKRRCVSRASVPRRASSPCRASSSLRLAVRKAALRLARVSAETGWLPGTRLEPVKDACTLSRAASPYYSNGLAISTAKTTVVSATVMNADSGKVGQNADK